MNRYFKISSKMAQSLLISRGGNSHIITKSEVSGVRCQASGNIAIEAET
jgi:hypothetical protein